MMDDPRPNLQSALKEAMKNKDNQRRDALRLVMSAIKQVEVDTQKELNAADVVDVLQKEAKKRRESIEEYDKAGRADLVEQERAELTIIEGFLPQSLSAGEIAAIVSEVIAQTGATSARDMGRVMGPVMQRVKGVADGKLVNQVIRELLSR